jgi:hypothetical protein
MAHTEWVEPFLWQKQPKKALTGSFIGQLM